MVRVAIIGVGHWGPNLVRSFNRHVNSEVQWVVDLDQERLDAVLARFPKIRVSKDPRDVMHDVDAVVVATPTVSHWGLVKLALEERKHVFVEKPLTDDVKSAQEVVELARSVERVLLVGHVFLYNSAVRWVKHFLDGGEQGQLYYLSSQRTNFGPIRSDVGVAWDLAAQDVAIFNYWLGTNPISASASGSACINDGVEDFAFLTLRYPGPILAHIHVSWLHPRKTREIAVVAERRMLLYDDMNLSEPVRVFDNGVSNELRARPGYEDTFVSFRSSVHVGAVRTPNVILEEPLQVEVDHFLDCVVHGKEPMTSGREGLRVIKALEAVQKSIVNHGKEETVDL